MMVELITAVPLHIHVIILCFDQSKLQVEMSSGRKILVWL